MPSATLNNQQQGNLGLAMPAWHTFLRALATIALGICDAILQSRQRQADREIARYLAQSGGRLTDEIERRRMGQFSSTAFGPY